MTKKRLQNKVKKQQQEIYRLEGILKRTVIACRSVANIEEQNYFDDRVARYAFIRLSEKIIESLGEGK